ncbi:MAG: ComF family protein [Thermodesulfobacteriota bacterium]
MGSFIERLFQFLLPPQCHCCERFLDEGPEGVCPDCLAKIHWITPPFCSVCGAPFVSQEVRNHPCSSCLTQRRYFTTARSLGAYQGPLQEAIHRWKYEGKITLTPFWERWMTEGFYRYWGRGRFDLLIPVPLHKDRLRERGFNQALLLVKALSRRTRIPYRKRVLQKVRPTLPQVSLSRVEREKEVRGSFEVAGGEDLEGKTILLVDDVYTTGATVNECSKVLRDAGAKRVDVFTLAHALKN